MYYAAYDFKQKLNPLSHTHNLSLDQKPIKLYESSSNPRC